MRSVVIMLLSGYTSDDPRHQELLPGAIPLGRLEGSAVEDAALAARWEHEFQVGHVPRSA